MSTHGKNEDEEPEELVKFLKFAGEKPSNEEKDYDDPFIRRLQEAVKGVKASREMGARYMTFQELLKDEREAGRAEGRADTLISQVKKKLEKNQTAEEIADALEQDIDVIRGIISEIEQGKESN